MSAAQLQPPGDVDQVAIGGTEGPSIMGGPSPESAQSLGMDTELDDDEPDELVRELLEKIGIVPSLAREQSGECIADYMERADENDSCSVTEGRYSTEDGTDQEDLNDEQGEGKQSENEVDKPNHNIEEVEDREEEEETIEREQLRGDDAGAVDRQSATDEAGGAVVRVRYKQRSLRPDAELGVDPIDPAMAAADDGRRRRTRHKERTSSRRRKERSGRSRSTHSRSTRSRSSRSRSSRSRDGAHSRSPHSRRKRSRKHKKHRRHLEDSDSVHWKDDPQSPTVNPIFLWVKQDECRILSVMCEDYDRRNRITLTKTTNGWRAIPKTERFASVLTPKIHLKRELLSNSTSQSGEDECIDDKEGDDCIDKDEDDCVDKDEDDCIDKDEYDCTDKDEDDCIDKDEYDCIDKNGEECAERDEDGIDKDEVENDEREESDDEEDEEGVDNEESESLHREELKESAGEPDENSVDASQQGDPEEENDSGTADDDEAEQMADAEDAEEHDQSESPEPCTDVGAKDGEGEVSDEDVGDSHSKPVDEVTVEFDVGVPSAMETEAAEVERNEGSSQVKAVGQVDSQEPKETEQQYSISEDLAQSVHDLHESVQKAIESEFASRDVVSPEDDEFMDELLQRLQDSHSPLDTSLVAKDDSEKSHLPPSDPADFEQTKDVNDVNALVHNEEHVNIPESNVSVNSEEMNSDEVRSSLCMRFRELNETERVPRLPKDLEVSIVTAPNSPPSSKSPTTRRKSPPSLSLSPLRKSQNSPLLMNRTSTPDLSPIRLSASTTITPLPCRSPLRVSVSTSGNSPAPSPLSLPSPSNTSPVTPKQQQHKFLESLLASPKKSDLAETLIDQELLGQEQPLDLGLTQRSSSRDKDADASSRTNHINLNHAEPPAKKPKLDDLTLRNLLNRQPGSAEKHPEEKDSCLEVKKIKHKRSSQDSVQSQAERKSRLLELLSVTDLDPLAQLKQVLSDPDLVVPDPLLVPRARLQALVTSPAQEIPRLLAQNPENRVPFSTPSCDPDMCVVPLSHLQSLLQPESKQSQPIDDYHRQLLEAQIKGDAVLQQMLWLPYLNQLEAAYSAYPGYMPGYDYKSQLELQTALASWQEAMLKAGTIDPLLMNNNNNSSKNNKNLKPPPPAAKVPPTPPAPVHQGTNPRQLSTSYSDKPQAKYPPSYVLPRSPPVAPLSGYRPPAQPVLPPPKAPPRPSQRPIPSVAPPAGRNSPTLFAAPQRPYHYQQQRQQQERLREYEKQQAQEYQQQLLLLQQLQMHQQLLAQQQQAYMMPTPAVKPKIDREHERRKSEGGRPPTCKSLLSLLSSQREARRSPSPSTSPHSESALLAALGSRTPYPLARPSPPRLSPGSSPIPSSACSPLSGSIPISSSSPSAPRAPYTDFPGRRTSTDSHHSDLIGEQRKKPSQGAKLKVKNLVDPNAKPRLLKLEAPVVPPSVPPDDVTSPNLWHPLFSSHQKTYNSPWQWTTVTVNGE